MLQTYINPSPSRWPALCERTKAEQSSEIASAVARILADVREGGDKALLRLEKQFDGATLGCLEVSEAEKAEASAAVPEALKQALSTAKSNIERFHRAQLPFPVSVETFPGVTCRQRAVPIQRVGLYIPGGRAPLFSTVLMLAVPASVAGCPDVILCSPPGPTGRVSPAIIYAATLCGVAHIYKCGGAQAIAAMAYGTGTISRRDKIFGPGNRYVMAAKQAVSVGDVAIDMPAGPSEVMVLADSSAVPSFVAADLLSQAEHGPDSQAMLVCTSEDIAAAVKAEVLSQMEALPRRSSIASSLEGSRIVVLERTRMAPFANAYAPEHLIVSVSDPWQLAGEIYAAGSIFIGNYSTESAGDYASGTNHTLPTSGWARSYSGVNIDSFMRKITCQELSPAGLQALSPTIIEMASAEGLDAHAEAVKIRLKG